MGIVVISLFCQTKVHGIFREMACLPMYLLYDYYFYGNISFIPKIELLEYFVDLYLWLRIY